MFVRGGGQVLTTPVLNILTLQSNINPNPVFVCGKKAIILVVDVAVGLLLLLLTFVFLYLFFACINQWECAFGGLSYLGSFFSQVKNILDFARLHARILS